MNSVALNYWSPFHWAFRFKSYPFLSFSSFQFKFKARVPEKNVVCDKSTLSFIILRRLFFYHIRIFSLHIP